MRSDQQTFSGVATPFPVAAEYAIIHNANGMPATIPPPRRARPISPRGQRLYPSGLLLRYGRVPSKRHNTRGSGVFRKCPPPPPTLSQPTQPGRPGRLTPFDGCLGGNAAALILRQSADRRPARARQMDVTSPRPDHTFDAHSISRRARRAHAGDRNVYQRRRLRYCVVSSDARPCATSRSVSPDTSGVLKSGE